MRILITGGAGFIGARLAHELLQRGELDGRRIDELHLMDVAPPPPHLASDPRVRVHVGTVLDFANPVRAEPLPVRAEPLPVRAEPVEALPDRASPSTLRQSSGQASSGRTGWDWTFDAVFHLAAAVSGECEADFDLGMRSNLRSTRALLECLRRAGNVPRLVFASSVAVYGAEPGQRLPDFVEDTLLPVPQTSYGTQKLACEFLIADYTRKGFLDGRSARLMTVTVRPGRPNGAASSFFSGIIREPLAGLEAICPVGPEVTHPVASPARTVQGLIRVHEATRDELGGRLGLNLPALNVSVAEMLDALADVAGADVRRRVRFERDERIAGIVAGWARGARSDRAHALGLEPDGSFRAVIEQYITDCTSRPGYPADALRGIAGKQ